MSEILAPAGSLDALYAAVRCGADAVYLAGSNFNARKNAKNFTDSELKEAVDYCHIHGVKVYHTLNTLVKESELESVKSELKRILERNEDALILQDLGLIEMVKEICPDMPLHGSTQMSVHTVSGAKYLEELGFKRVVLSREMSREEILEIRENTSLEIEVFVHGALCMSVSGQCYMSSMFGGRSGNRGLCAQPCRLGFSAENGTGRDLSLKDNSIISHLPELAEMGIDSFKIEGRMKRPEYVAAAVTACRNSLNGRLSESETERLKSVFSREGFTDGYYFGKLGRNMFGSRSYEDVTAATGSVFKEIQGLYHKEVQTVPCSLKAVIKKDKNPELTINVNDLTFTARIDCLPEAAINKPLDTIRLSEQLSKLGGTAFYAENVDITLDEGIMLPMSRINELRRAAVAGIEAELIKKGKKEYSDKHFAFTNFEIHQPSKKYARFSSEEQITCTERFDKIIIPMFSKDEAFKQYPNAVAEIPRGMFGREKQVEERLRQLKELGVAEVASGNIGASYLAKEAGLKVISLIGSNITNSISANVSPDDEYIASFELTLKELEEIKSNKNKGVLVYGHIPLMLTRNCPVRNGKTCKECSNSSHITDRKGKALQVRCNFGCSEIFNPLPVYMFDRLDEIKNYDFDLLYFTYESKKEAAQIIEKYENREKADFEFTRGLYYKGAE